MKTQSDNFRFFVKNHDALYSKYPNKNLVIQNQKVIYAEDTFENALNKAMDNGLEVGTFIIQECAKGEDSYVQNFSSRVIFA